jgi:hypothetical protein
MVKTVATRVMWLGRATVFLVGLAVILALVFGMTSAAFGANGDFLKLGSLKNVATNTTALVGKVAAGSALSVKNPSGGSALDLQVGDPAADPATKNTAPMKVNSQARVTNLNSDELDGNSSSAFLGAGQKAADSDKLDGIDSTNFVQENSTSFVHGNGTAYQGAVDVVPGSTSNLILDTQDPQIGLQYACPSDVTTNGTVYVLNRTFVQSSQTVRLFSDNGSTDPSYQSLDSGQVHSEAAAANGEHLTFRVQASGPKLVTIDVFSVHDPAGRVFPGDCHVDAQAFVTR